MSSRAGSKKKKEVVTSSPSSSDSEQEETKSDAEDSGTAKVQLPMARVRKIVKSDPDVKKITHEAAQLIARSTELFVEFMVREGYQITKDDSRKTFQYKDLATCVQENEILDFLLDVIPQKQTRYEIEKRLQSKQQAEKAGRQPSPPPSSSSSSSTTNGTQASSKNQAAAKDGEKDEGEAPQKDDEPSDEKEPAGTDDGEKEANHKETEKKDKEDEMEE